MVLLGQALCVAAGLYSRIAPTERGGYHLARLVRRFIPRDKWRSRFTTPDALMLDLDLATYPDCSMAMGLYERDTCRQLRKLLRPGAWFVDGGANIGYFSVLAACWVGKRGRVDAYEPDPLNRERLQANVAFNGVSRRVRIHSQALSDHSQVLQMRHGASVSENHGSSGVYASGESFEAEAVRMDHHLTSDGLVPDVIKLDVEGSELAALRGMTGILSAPRPPALIIEHNPASCRAAGHRPSDLWRALLDIRPAYRMSWIGWRMHPLAVPEQLDGIERVGNLLAMVGDGKPEVPPVKRQRVKRDMASWWASLIE